MAPARRHQLHTPDLGLCQSTFPRSAKLVLRLFTHIAQLCQ